MKLISYMAKREDKAELPFNDPPTSPSVQVVSTTKTRQKAGTYHGELLITFLDTMQKAIEQLSGRLARLLLWVSHYHYRGKKSL